jgi:ABC-type dipeptide/oligopeptide/nickel transport system ATPase component
MLLITHDLGIVAEHVDNVAVMRKGEIVEYAPVKDLFANPRHPYTKMLLDSIPKIK